MAGEQSCIVASGMGYRTVRVQVRAAPRSAPSAEACNTTAVREFLVVHAWFDFPPAEPHLISPVMMAIRLIRQRSQAAESAKTLLHERDSKVR
jgi:hypothetical protein